jgi:multidrug efflux pump subunit AcrA (membrane-fusion protein)
MELVQAIESVMEECVDQDQEVITPAGEASTIVNRAAGELATKHGPTTVLSLPLRDREQVVGAITIERAVDQPFALDEIETLRLTCDLSTARLVDLEQHDRWFGARAARAIHRGAGVVIGPTHTWAKLAALATAAVIAFAVFTKGTYRVESPFVVEAIQQQVVAAPFDGYLLEALVSNGDRVEAGKTILARLDTAQLQLERAKAEAERRGYIKKSQISRRENKIGEEQVAQADADRLKAQIDLLTWQIDRAVIVAPIDGVIVSGDLDKKIGGPVQVGQTLFEIAPIESLRARLSVPEDDVPDVQLQQIGQLAAVSHPGDYLPIIVERIDPVAQVVDQHNVFSVRASLRDQPQWLRPGMEGVARLDVEQRRYVSIWTRSLVNWIRMKLWL